VLSAAQHPIAEATPMNMYVAATNVTAAWVLMELTAAHQMTVEEQVLALPTSSVPLITCVPAPKQL
jgi:hypothetical protein